MSKVRIAAVLLGLGLARLAVAQALPVELVSPRTGVTLAGGEEAVLEWRAPPLPGVEEWEAFLSVNGGVSYAFRLTPHLDVALRRVSVRLPMAPTDDARLLLRFGDERRETLVELPVRFAITVPAAATLASPVIDVRVQHFAPGEAARPGDPGVVAWSAGPRSGDRPVEVEAGEAPLGWRPAASASSVTPAAAAEPPPAPAGISAPTESGAAAPPPTPPRATSAAALPASPLAVLDRTQRLNE
ncbi:MAG: hypothetical protein ACM3OB_07405 [Acidobacteriota bacterium]